VLKRHRAIVLNQRFIVFPAQFRPGHGSFWIPAFAGMTGRKVPGMTEDKVPGMTEGKNASPPE